ncbi:MAG: sensor domain-containing diguanylate cyclase [Deltaproteobacteria bacterium]|nr:sensor domain-containing diguanylate cyclase [Deltaproteobacteria bacterium]
MRINVAETKILKRVLQRERKKNFVYDERDLSDIFRGILKSANEFVPSESGSIFIDEPMLGKKSAKPGKLYFVACYGKGSAKLTGNNIPAGTGIVGKTYTGGKPYISKNVDTDKNFYQAIDKKTKFHTQSIICVPIEIRGTVIGVLELINRLDRINYDKKDLKLLKIFASYTSTLIQNALDAKRFGELSIKDNLTGLYNDRFFYESLTKAVRSAIRNSTDVSIAFLDLDHFKQVNDMHGHLAGSQLLTELGAQILALTGKNKSLIPVRYGGDEFVVILAGKGVREAKELAEVLRKTIEDHTYLAKRVPGVIDALHIKDLITGSFGVASLKTNIKKGTGVTDAREALIKAADNAMYISKEAGRNTVTIAKGFFDFKAKKVK